ncbi:hypothetical protein OAD66_08275 [Bacteroidia bacterium]|nr:hypothetical protein [Bacteroidia bacterium]MDB4107343.1 hypothetical protein [Bacteroidia bacterium]MDB9883111.1 hypothetical protein [Bacteroidia bacterium]
MKSVFAMVVLSLFAIFGCKKNELMPDIDHSSKYQPLDVGYTWTYQMDSISFYGYGSQKPDTIQYLVKRTVSNSFIDNAGIQSYTLSSYAMIDTVEGWIFQRNYIESNTPSEIKRTISDVTKVVISFPLAIEKEWDANLYNAQEAVECYFETIHSPKTVGVTDYDSTATVMCEDKIFQTKRVFTKGTYAANTGLILQEVENLENIDPEKPKDIRGHKYTLTLISFEK